jgi:hypothetical protein
MSDKKIFIALSQREARSILTAMRFLTAGCSKPDGEGLIFSPENAETIGITADELSEMWDFSDRLKQLADEQAELEAIIDEQEPATSTQL